MCFQRRYVRLYLLLVRFDVPVDVAAVLLVYLFCNTFLLLKVLQSIPFACRHVAAVLEDKYYIVQMFANGSNVG